MVVVHKTDKKSGLVAFTKEACDGTPFWLKKDDNELETDFHCRKLSGDSLICSQTQETKLIDIATEIAIANKITLPKAIDEACKRNPELYEQYTDLMTINSNRRR
jgi:hypothetical protein